jgi:putative addiction module component (TIGR02574 family)
MTKQELLATAQTLPKEERLELAMDLWEAIELSNADLPLSEEQRADLDERIAEDDADARPSEDWDSLRKKLLDGEF